MSAVDGAQQHRRSWLVPEVVQSSAMDCGPAALKALLGGFGIRASYGRLREACQTSLDGTSIDSLEEIANRLGLEAQQLLVPADHLFLDEARLLPAIITMWTPGKATHFAVAWRRHGRLVQVMDPSTGRRWPSLKAFGRQLYVHEMDLSARVWLEWARSDEFIRPLERRLKKLHAEGPEIRQIVTTALQDDDWVALARVDAAVRMIAGLVGGGGIPSGPVSVRSLRALIEHGRENPSAAYDLIPSHYWFARSTVGVGDVRLRGALIIQAQIEPSRQRAASARPPTPGSPDAEIEAILTAPSTTPESELLKLVAAVGGVPLAVLALAASAAALAVVIEALLFRSMIAAANELAVPRLHWTAAAVLGGLLIVTTWLEVPLAGGLMRVGRRIENRLRLELFRRIPRLGDRYFHSRPVSDMAERSHSLHSIRHLPSLVVRLFRSLAETGFIVCAMFWLAPRSGWIAAVIALVGLLLPLTIVPLLTELDLRLRTHTGAVMRYVLDAGLGLTSIRAHTSERAVRRQHEALVTEWARARLNLDRVRSYLVLMQGAVGVIGAAVLVATSVSRIDSPADSLLCAYWALRMSALGEDVVSVVLQYPRRRSVTTRVMEPLTATTEPVGQQSDPVALDVDKPSSSGVDLDFVDVTVRAGGQTILEQVNLSVAAGQHVAIVGASGAGKSSLVGVLLGWHRPASGHVMVQHQAITSERLAGLRGSTAWIDPEVHLWNRSALENLLYGASSEDGAPLVTTIEAAELLDVIDRLPNGLQTPLGEGGGLVSGGEGQRIRFGRMLRRVGCPLVILDEPFRGLDRPARARLLTRARALWRGSTLLCITHDVSETLTFDRVLVLEGGKLVEDLDPSRLESSAAPRFHQMLTAEQSVRRDLWRNPVWRRVRLEGGRLREAD